MLSQAPISIRLASTSNATNHTHLLRCCENSIDMVIYELPKIPMYKQKFAIAHN